MNFIFKHAVVFVLSHVLDSHLRQRSHLALSSLATRGEKSEVVMWFLLLAAEAFFGRDDPPVNSEMRDPSEPTASAVLSDHTGKIVDGLDFDCSTYRVNHGH